MTVRTRSLTALAALGLLALPSLTAEAAETPAHDLLLAQAATPLQIPDANASQTGGTAATPAPAPAPAPSPAPAPAPETTAPTPAPTPAPAPDATEPAPKPDGTGAGADQSQPDDGSQTTPDDGSGTDNGDTPPDELSLGEIPVIETIELTPDLAKRALDSYLVAKTKYADSNLDQYENLQDFVDQTPEGKAFEADVKAAGFANVTDWNLAITTLGVIYGSVVDDQTPDLLQQIKEVEADTELAQDIKDRMVKALKAMIPSENNKKVVEDLLADPVYGPKLKQLDIEEE